MLKGVLEDAPETPPRWHSGQDVLPSEESLSLKPIAVNYLPGLLEDEEWLPRTNGRERACLS
jgi:hypothetical protein